MCYIFSVGDVMSKTENTIEIDNFLNAISSMLESKYILIDRKISDILYAIANTRDVYNVIAVAMINYDFKTSWRQAVNSTFIKLPEDENDRIAFIFCLLNNIDDKNLDITMVLDKYFSYDLETKPYELFCKNIIVEFKRLILKKLGLDYQKEVVFEGEPEHYDEFEMLSNMLRDFVHFLAVKKKVKLYKVSKENFIAVVSTFEQAVKEKNVGYFYSFLVMIDSALVKNKELKLKFKAIKNLAMDIMEKTHETY